MVWPKEIMEERRGVSSPMQELRMFGKATTILFPHLVCWKSGWKYSKCKRDWVLSAPLAKSVYDNAQQQKSNRSKIKFPWYKNYSVKLEKNIFDMYNLFSIFIERFTIFTVLIFVILKNLMVFISPPLWTLWNYKKQKLRDGLIIATGSLPHPFCILTVFSVHTY